MSTACNYLQKGSIQIGKKDNLLNRNLGSPFARRNCMYFQKDSNLSCKLCNLLGWWRYRSSSQVEHMESNCQQKDSTLLDIECKLQARSRKCSLVNCSDKADKHRMFR